MIRSSIIDAQMDRLQKILSQAGVASRRAAEKLIAEGRVSVNGTTVREMGTKADAAADEIRVDGRRIKAAQTLRYILLNKPAGYVTTRSDPQRRPTVIDLLRGVREYVYPVGRLDYDTEGLLLLTNDGDMAASLTHPRHGVERSYEARVAGVPDANAIDRLRKGIPLDGRRTQPADVDLLSRRSRGTEERDALLRITIREGRNRQVRRMCEAIGHPVKALSRTRIGSLTDRQLKPGMWRELRAEEIRALKKSAATLPAVPSAAIRPAVPSAAIRPAVPSAAIRPAVPSAAIRPAVPSAAIRPAVKSPRAGRARGGRRAD
jgi:23S rRNA pseudouridine2605 synthase